MNEMNVNESDNVGSIIDELFDILRVNVPGMHYMLIKGVDVGLVKREWAKAFALTKPWSKDRLRIGINKIRTQEFKFAIGPGEFIALCSPSPEEFGLLTVHEAHEEACYGSYEVTDKYEGGKVIRMAHKFSHPTVRYARNKVGSSYMRKESREKTFPLFKKYYEQACQDFMAGKNLEQIDPPKPKVSSAAEDRIQKEIKRTGANKVPQSELLRNILKKLKK